MIKREIFVATIMAFPAEFAKFAHAYGSYCGELKKAHKRIPDSVIRSGLKKLITIQLSDV